MEKKICLVYPPLSVHEFPHLALPLLKGYLQKNGHSNIVVKDFNVPIMDEIIYNGYYKIEKHYREKNIRMPVHEVMENMKRAKNILVDSKKRGKDEWAFKIINTYLKIAGSNISETCFIPNCLSEIIDKYITTDINTDSNCIIKYIKCRVIPSIMGCHPDIVGFSVPFASQIFYSLLIGKELKKKKFQSEGDLWRATNFFILEKYCICRCI